MWKYVQKNGALFHDGELVEFGYAGKKKAKNNPDAQCLKDTGPIPRGWWTIAAATDDGPSKVSLPLRPDIQTNVCGRSGFLVHGDSKSNPGTASEGCIIVSRAARERIRDSGDTRLQVISGLETVNGISVTSRKYMRILERSRKALKRYTAQRKSASK